MVYIRRSVPSGWDTSIEVGNVPETVRLPLTTTLPSKRPARPVPPVAPEGAAPGGGAPVAAFGVRRPADDADTANGCAQHTGVGVGASPDARLGRGVARDAIAL